MRHLVLLPLVFALQHLNAAHAAPATATIPASSAAQVTTQLPRGVTPLHYQIEIAPHADQMVFDGKVAIAIEVAQATRSITLNAHELTIGNATLRGANQQAYAPAISLNAAEQTATFTFTKNILPGKYTLSIAYRGKIGTQTSGLFAIDYATPAGPRRSLSTQFESADARRFVPSWDEPNYKASFALTATVPAGQMAVSNMPESGSVAAGAGLKRVSFATTPKMSSYLLFFGMGDFERASRSVAGTSVGVITRRGATAQATFALDAAAAVLQEYNDYFGVKYPLPKLDNIASPGNSQGFAAMENWGAIFTFENSLLLDPVVTTEKGKQWVFQVAAHEIAHQWFGDLVTMQWWDDLWLNEGFASWMEQRTTAKLHPEWHTALEAVHDRSGAMALDALKTTHPVVQKVATVEQANQAFDAITYQKGQAVIGMLENYVGEEAWRRGVRSYMAAHAYGNTSSDDLWRAVEQAAGQPILAIAHDFTLQPGVPLLRVSAQACRDNATVLHLEQGEFTKDSPQRVALKWRVPVVAQAGGASAVRTVLMPSADGASLTVPGCGAIVANAGQRGYYRTLYAAPMMASLVQQFAQVPPIDQLGLLDDSFALAMVGSAPISDYLALVQATPAAADPAVWSSIAGTLDTLNGYYKGEAGREAAFRRFALARLAPVFAALGWEARAGEASAVTNLRATLLAVMNGLDDPAVIAEARRRFALMRNGAAGAAAPMAPELRQSILAIVARHADAATWDSLHAMALAEKTPLIRDKQYALLAASLDAGLAQRTLALALTEEPGVTNSANMISQVAQQHSDLAFDFAVAHREQIDPLVEANLRSTFYPRLGSASFDPAMPAKISRFAEAHIAATARRRAETVLASLAYRNQIRAERLPAIDAWLAQQAKAN